MGQVLFIAHTIICLLLILIILLQQGKGAQAGALGGMGGGASSTVFGSKGAGGFLYRFTSLLAVLFFITSILLTRGMVQQTLVDSTEDLQQASPNSVLVDSLAKAEG